MDTIAQLQRELDRTKSEVFIRRGEGHLAHLMCGVNIIWAEDAVTAYNNGMIIAINPEFFMQLKTPTRETLFASHLWKIAMLFLVRGEGKVWRLWQMATSYWVNNMLHNKGYSFEGLSPHLDHRYDNMSADEIYADLVERDYDGTLDDLGAIWGYKNAAGEFDVDDLRHPTEGQMVGNGLVPPTEPSVAHKMINTVVQASQYMAQAPGGYGGDNPMVDMIRQFLKPKVLWEKELLPFFTAQEGLDYTWSIPNRRIRSVYLPSLVKNSEGGLTHIAFMGDSSGSITKSQLVRINSEAAFIKKRFNPEKFTMINFDDEIQMVYEMSRQDPFDEMKVVGRGGTHLAPVRQWIIDNKPKAVVIFSDLCCDPMEPLPPENMVPILWIVFNNQSADVPHGKMIHIAE